MPLERPPALEARQTTALALGMAVALLAAPAAAIVDPRVFKCEDAAAGAIGKWASQRAACIVQCEVVRTGGDATRVCSDPPGFDPVTLACMGPPDAQYEATVMQVCPPENFPRCAPYEGETPQSFAAGEEAAQAALIDPVVAPELLCDPARLSCEAAVVKALGALATNLGRCLRKCYRVLQGRDDRRTCTPDTADDPFDGLEPRARECTAGALARAGTKITAACPTLPDCGSYSSGTPGLLSLVTGPFAAAYADPASNPYCADTVRLISIAADGIRGGDGDSAPSGISDDGHVVAFTSAATNLVTDDTNGVVDAFVHDWTTGTTERVSVASDGSEGNRDSFALGLSPDGRFVVFDSDATNLVAGDANGSPDVFVHDRVMRTTERVSVASDGTGGNGYSAGGGLSADGRFVAFLSWADNLVAGDTNANSDIFVHDRTTGATERVSVASDGTQGNLYSNGPIDISADGRFVVFVSFASNLVPGDTNGNNSYQGEDVFLHDRMTGATERVSLATNGSELTAGGFGGRISADGRIVVYNEHSVDYSGPRVYAYDRTTGARDVPPFSQPVYFPAISAEGRFVGGGNEVYDRQTGSIETVTLTARRVFSPSPSGDGFPLPSGDGRFIAFESASPNLVAYDHNNKLDVFLHDRATPPPP